jgi:hypothetical protein
MQADIRERKAEIPKTNPDGFSGRFCNPSKSTTDEKAIQKVRTEAEAARAKIPPDMWAEPYGGENAKNREPESGFSKGFKAAEQAAVEEKKPKMSSVFNGGSKANKVASDLRPEGPKAKR